MIIGWSAYSLADNLDQYCLDSNPLPVGIGFFIVDRQVSRVTQDSSLCSKALETSAGFKYSTFRTSYMKVWPYAWTWI